MIFNGVLMERMIPVRKLFIKIILIGLIGCFGISDVYSGEADSISVVGQLKMPGLTTRDIWGYTDSASGKQYALLCVSKSGLRVIDVTDPSNPVLAGSISGNGVNGFDVKTWKNYAYTVAGAPSVGGKIIDLADPANPILVGEFPGGHNIAISDSGYLYISAPGLRVFDLNADPLNPVMVDADTSCDSHDVSIVGQRLYNFSPNCGIIGIYDISRPDTLVLLGTFYTNANVNHSGGPSKDGNYLFVDDELAKPEDADITVWDISDLSNPKIVDSFTDPDANVHNLYVIDDYAYVSFYTAGFRVFDISDPTNISLVAEYDTDTTASGPGFVGNFGLYTLWGSEKILASDKENGLYIFSFTGTITGISEEIYNQSSDLRVYPNPSNGSGILKLEYSLDKQVAVNISIYGLNGQLIVSFDEGIKSSGTHKLSLPTANWTKGMYAVRLRTKDEEKSIKFIITK